MTQHRNGKILALLFTGVLIGALDISIVGPAIPAIEQTIKVDHRSLSWIFSIYVLFNLVGVSLLSKLSDLYGRRNIYIFSVAVFALGSAIVALSENITFLLIGRAIQGFGSSGIFPVASAVIGDIFPPEKRGRTLGMIGAVFGIAFIIGPVIAGVLLLWFDWNALFLVNLPIAAVVIFYSWRLLPSKKSLQKPHFDWMGMILIAVLVSSFAYGINNIEAAEGFKGIFSIEVYPFLMITMITLPLFIFIEKRSPSPVVKIQLFDVKQIRIVGIVAFGTGIIQAVTIFCSRTGCECFRRFHIPGKFYAYPFCPGNCNRVACSRPID
jgi:multidrug resistance protein